MVELTVATLGPMHAAMAMEAVRVKAATSPQALAAVLMSASVVDSVRKEVRRQSGVNADAKDIVRLLRTEVLRLEALV